MFPLTKSLTSLRLVIGMPNKEIWDYPLKSRRVGEGLQRNSVNGQVWKRFRGGRSHDSYG